MEHIETLKQIIHAIEEKKGEDTKVIDISKVSSIADYFIITTANNVNQVHTISEEIQEKLAKEGVEPRRVEGYKNATWILLDYNDIVIHVFERSVRAFYDLERIWSDGKEVEI